MFWLSTTVACRLQSLISSLPASNHQVILSSSSIYLYTHLIITGRFWKDPRNLKSAFEVFAREKKFDPSLSSEWYMLTNQQISSLKVSISSFLFLYYLSFIPFPFSLLFCRLSKLCHLIMVEVLLIPL